MLYEIICDNFKQKRVQFNTGLNTILGDDYGSNSIGKSTFLMIVDFAFGGKDYVLKSTDIQRNIGNHLIKFCFEFSEKKYYFTRKTDDLENVSVCDKNYKMTSVLSLEKYCEMLKNLYNINLDEISFRDFVGRFSRIYGKDNLDEKRPLNIVHNEKSGAPTNALLKIFGLYSVISDLELQFKDKETKLKAFKSAQKFNFISSIGKRKYNTNDKELAELNKEKVEFANELDSNLLDLDSLKTEQILKLKQSLSVVRRYRSKLYSQLEIVKSNLDETTNLKTEKFDALLTFFPVVNVNLLSEVEGFHMEIKKILKVELKKQKDDINKLISIAQNEVDELKMQINEVFQMPNLSKVVLKKYSDMQTRIEVLEKENESFNKLLNFPS